MEFQTAKYKLLVLMDKSEASYDALKNAINLAKLVDGSIEVFQVKKLTSELNYENQLVAMRAIDEEHFKQNKEYREIVAQASKNDGLSITFNYAYGNAKNEIKDHVKKTNPDVIILGKRKKKSLSFLGDGITKSLLKNHNGPVLISGDDEAFTSYNNKSIGFLNNVEGIEKIALVNDLKQHTQEPLKLFKVEATPSSTATTENAAHTNEHQVHEIEASNHTASGMANLISDNNLTLLCIPKNVEPKNKVFYKTIEQTKIPVLILNNN